MSRKQILGLLLVLLFTFVTWVIWPRDPGTRPPVVLHFINLTNLPHGGQGALCKLQNRSDRVIFYSACGEAPKYSGNATTTRGEIQMQSEPFTGGIAAMLGGTNRSFIVELPANTLRWKISVYCHDSDREARLAWKIVTSRTSRFVPWFVTRALFRRCWEQGFEVSTPVITNVPPHTTANTSPPLSGLLAKGH